MNKEFLAIVIIILLLGSVLFYFFSQKKILPLSQFVNQNVSDLGNNQTQNVSFVLDLFAGGSIFGSSFDVKISGTRVTYRETTQGGSSEIHKIERLLSPVELSDIHRVVADTGLVSLRSQDFTKYPLLPDQASYRVAILLSGKENKIHCGIPLSGVESDAQCQKQIQALITELNRILGVGIR
jgi:hypothetical protein